MDKNEKKLYLKKHEIILQMLEGLRDYWKPASAFMALFKSKHITPQAIDGMMAILKKAVDEVESDEARKKLSSAVKTLAEIKRIEESDRSEDQKLAEFELLHSELFLI